MHAPTLLFFELANVCLKKIRRFPERRAQLLTAHALAMEVDLIADDVDHAAVLALAERQGLTAYDASYLWLSRELDAELVTLDARLGAAARR